MTYPQWTVGDDDIMKGSAPPDGTLDAALQRSKAGLVRHGGDRRRRLYSITRASGASSVACDQCSILPRNTHRGRGYRLAATAR